MCHSIAEGGQRCAPHTRRTLIRRTLALHPASALEPAAFAQAQVEWEHAAVAYASTSDGQEHFTAQADLALSSGDHTAHARLDNIVRRGEAMRAANKTTRALIQDADRFDLTVDHMATKAYTSVAAEDLTCGDIVLIAGRNQVVEAKDDDRTDTVLRLRDGQGRNSVKRTRRTARVRKLLLGVLAAAIAMGGTTGTAFALTDQSVPPTAQSMPALDKEHATPPTPTPPTPTLRAPKRPEPVSVAGYQKMLNRVDVAEWGGADVSYSVDLPDGRRVWLYGDTLSGNNGLVRNSALVQHGGDLHVSHGGQQVLPSEPKAQGRTTIYWPEVARVAKDGTLRVVAAPISVGKNSVWDFYRTGPTTKSRVAIVAIDTAGNLTFQRWSGWENRPDIDYDEVGYNDTRPLEMHHWGYAETTHPNIMLADGSHLVTMSQNWDNPMSEHENPDGSLRYHDWRPLFFSTTSRP